MTEQPQTLFSLEICELNRWLSLGATQSERAQLQEVNFTLKYHCTTLPHCTQVDDISQALCYATLIEALDKTIQDSSFALVEYLAQQSMQVFERIATASIIAPHIQSLELICHKVAPPVAGLKGGAKVRIIQLFAQTTP
jgi:FolB domain-containing protein